MLLLSRVAPTALTPARAASGVTVKPRPPSSSPVTPRLAPVPVSPGSTGLTAASALPDTGIMAPTAARVSLLSASVFGKAHVALTCYAKLLTHAGNELCYVLQAAFMQALFLQCMT